MDQITFQQSLGKFINILFNILQEEITKIVSVRYDLMLVNLISLKL